MGRRGWDSPGFLSCDVFLDLDGESEDPLENAKALLPEVQAILQRFRHWDLLYVAFSGRKGFHVLYADPVEYRSPPGPEREKEASEFRKALAESLEGEGWAVDLAVLKDTRRILRLPFTLHSKSGLLCLPLDPKGVLRGEGLEALLGKSFLKEALELKSAGRPMTSLRVAENRPGPPGPKAPSKAGRVFFGFCASSRIPGRGKHVIIAEMVDPRKALRKFPQWPWWEVRIPGKRYAVSPVVLSFSKVAEVMRVLGARNLSVFLRNGHALLPLSEFVGERARIRPEVKFLGGPKETADVSEEWQKALEGRPARLIWRFSVLR